MLRTITQRQRKMPHFLCSFCALAGGHKRNYSNSRNSSSGLLCSNYCRMTFFAEDFEVMVMYWLTFKGQCQKEETILDTWNWQSQAYTGILLGEVNELKESWGKNKKEEKHVTLNMSACVCVCLCVCVCASASLLLHILDLNSILGRQ
jgi:hypothetical protein